MKLCTYLVPLTVAPLLLSTHAWGQETTANSPPMEGSVPSSPSSTGTGTSPPLQDDPAVMPRPKASDVPLWKRALTHYSLGESDTALKLLSDGVHRCLDSEGSCSDAEIGTLYACVAIVQAGGNKAHGPAVVAFRKALALDSGIVVLGEYRTAEVDAAYREAKTGRRATTPVAQDSPMSFPQGKTEEELEEERQHELDLLKKRGFLLLTAYAQMGAVTAYRFETADSVNFSDGLGHLGGSVTLGAMPGETSGFTLGGRFKGGAFLTDRGGLGHYGLSGLIGGTTGRRQDNHFSYFLGGLGFDHYPALDTTAANLSFQGGASLGGLVLGGVVDAVVGPEVYAFVLGIELGFGTLVGK